MTRGSFFKSLLGLLVSPKLVSEINFDDNHSGTPVKLFSQDGKPYIPVNEDKCITQIEFEKRYGTGEYWVDYGYVYSVEMVRNNKIYTFHNGQLKLEK